MMKLLIYILGLLLMTTSAIAENSMAPGLWEVSLKIKTDGKVIRPAEQIKKSLASLPKEQQEEMLATLKERSGIDEKGNNKICYGPADLELREATISPMGDNCLSKVIKNTSNKVVINFACINGVTGSSTRFIKGAYHYSGVTKIISPEGKISEIVYKGEFFSPICQNVENLQI